MVLTDLQIKKLSCALGFIQGSAWTLMSLICLVLYNSPPHDLNTTTYMDSVNLVIYEFFLFQSGDFFDNQSFNGATFAGFGWIYFFLDVLWVVVSVYVWSQGISKKTALWSYVALAICLWDFLTVVILGADYGKCLDFARSVEVNPIVLEMMCANAILPVLVVAAKGFVLWFVNVAFALLLMNAANQK